MFDPAVAGLAGAAVSAAVTLVGTRWSSRNDEVRSLWEENRARGKDLAAERADRQASEKRLTDALQESEDRCAARLDQVTAEYDRRIEALEDGYRRQVGQLTARIAALGGA